MQLGSQCGDLKNLGPTKIYIFATMLIDHEFEMAAYYSIHDASQISQELLLSMSHGKHVKPTPTGPPVSPLLLKEWHYVRDNSYLRAPLTCLKYLYQLHRRFQLSKNTRHAKTKLIP